MRPSQSTRPRWSRLAASRRLLLVALAGLFAGEAAAQDAVLEALREYRQRVRTAEALLEVGPRAEVYGPIEIAVFQERYRRLRPHLPTLPLPTVALPPIVARAAPPPAEPPPPRALTEIRWHRTPPGEEHLFLDRFLERLWTAVSAAGTPIDTLPTPQVRARLNTVFGAPTRTPVARGQPDRQGGSAFIQFEYWFVVNDKIPFVVMDRNGPFGRGLMMIAAEDDLDLVEALRDDLVRLLMRPDFLMPYVDYFQAEDGRRWYRTGFDGKRYFVVPTQRPRWARRGHATGRWYDFR